MALTGLVALLVNQQDTLVPHIEERALKYTMRRYVMPQRVTVLTDMTGWNVRKVSEYLRTRRAGNLQEATDIPDTQMARVRKTEIEPVEVGDRHLISDRRSDTDLEPIIADTIEALGRGIGDRKEADLMRVAVSGFTGGNIDNSGSTYSVAMPIDSQFEFRKQARRGQLFHVIHPFQARDVMQDLVAYASGTNLAYRDQAIQGWNVPAFDGLNIAISEFLPRNVSHYVDIGADGGTFRLQVGVGYTVGENITATIAYDAVTATQASNIQTALNALDMSGYYSGSGTWTVAHDSTVASGHERFLVTPPSDLYLDGEEELRVAIDYDNNPTLEDQKSAYDLLTNPALSADYLGNARGVIVYEKQGATAKSLLFFPDALVYDVRKPLRVNFDGTINQGRTAEYSAYETYAIDTWRQERGMTIETLASSAFALA